MINTMTELLDKTIARVRDLPEDEQNAAAGALLEYLDGLRHLHITDDQLAEIRRRRATDRTYVSLADVRARFTSARS